MAYATAADLASTVQNWLADGTWSGRYTSEPAFVAAVYDRLEMLFGSETKNCCLTSLSHVEPRSAEAWAAFLNKDRGPDVRVLGCKKRVDIVIRTGGHSIGIEVEWLGDDWKNPDKLIEGVGQAMLSLEHRDRAILIMYCGLVPSEERENLRRVAENISQGTRLGIVIVP